MFFVEKVGECVSQTEKVKAATWEKAKRMAWDEVNVGDVIAECDEDAIEDQFNGEYHYINEEKAKKYATLNRGAWVNTPDGGEDFREDIFWWSDEPEEYLDSDGEPYDFEAMEEEYNRGEE